MIKIHYKSPRMQELEERADFEKGVLVEVVAPDEQELTLLQEKLKIEPSLIKDVLDPFEAPRLEIEDNGIIYVFFRVPRSEHDRIKTFACVLAIGKDFVLIASAEPMPFIERIRAKTEVHTTQRTQLVLQILRSTNNLYNNFLLQINRHINSLNIRAGKESIQNKDIMTFITFEEVLNEFTNSLIPHSTILSKLLGGKNIILYEEDRELIEDLLLSTEELIQLSKTSLRTSMNIRDAYSTILTNNLNRTIKFFTSLTIILTIAVIVPSIYGMNIALPFQDSPHAFALIMGSLVIISGGLLILFIYKKWL